MSDFKGRHFRAELVFCSLTEAISKLELRLAPKDMALIAEGRSYRWIAGDLGIRKYCRGYSKARTQPK